MKVLHIWDQAGTGSIIAKYQRDFLHYDRAELIQDKKHDKINISKYYDGFIYSGKIPFLFHCLSASRLYDVIHLHDSWFMILPLKIIYPKKKIIIHYHGTLVRANTLGKFRLFLEKFVNKILVATPDLLDYNYQSPPLYVPDPIDDKLFCNRPRPLNNKAFTLLKFNQSPIYLKFLLQKLDFSFSLDYQERKKGYSNGILYKDFHKKLEQYEYFIDIPMFKGEIIHAHSCTGLQARSMGLKVLSHDGTIKTGLPEEHTPESVVNYLDDIYKKVRRD